MNPCREVGTRGGCSDEKPEGKQKKLIFQLPLELHPSYMISIIIAEHYHVYIWTSSSTGRRSGDSNSSSLFVNDIPYDDFTYGNLQVERTDGGERGWSSVYRLQAW